MQSYFFPLDFNGLRAKCFKDFLMKNKRKGKRWVLTQLSEYLEHRLSTWVKSLLWKTVSNFTVNLAWN